MKHHLPLGQDLFGILIIHHFVRDGFEEETFLDRVVPLNVDLHLAIDRFGYYYKEPFQIDSNTLYAQR